MSRRRDIGSAAPCRFPVSPLRDVRNTKEMSEWLVRNAGPKRLTADPIDIY